MAQRPQCAPHLRKAQAPEQPAPSEPTPAPEPAETDTGGEVEAAVEEE